MVIYCGNDAANEGTDGYIIIEMATSAIVILEHCKYQINVYLEINILSSKNSINRAHNLTCMLKVYNYCLHVMVKKKHNDATQV